ncbi:MAG: hypothetical protein IT518_02560 [Burkholderiales bacterium]|nr:hypothetical protein [Burkholderiales bacterium]
MRPFTFAFLIAAVAALAGCGTIKNTIAEGDDQALMLGGNDPVAYFSENRAVRGSPRARQNWLIDYPENIKVGDAYWQSEVKDAYSRVQNFKRYTFKVPGYKTDAELDAIYLDRKKAGTLNPLAQKYGS